jgi:hypothetical protein
MENNKKSKKPKDPNLDENGKPKEKPLLPVLTEPEIRIANGNKNWLADQQEHNDYDFALFPLGDRGLNFIEKAFGAYPHRNASPIMFHDPNFKAEFMGFEGDETFHRYAGEWDFSMKGTPKDKSQELSEQMFNEKLAEFHQRVASESTRKPSAQFGSAKPARSI